MTSRNSLKMGDGLLGIKNMAKKRKSKMVTVNLVLQNKNSTNQIVRNQMMKKVTTIKIY